MIRKYTTTKRRRPRRFGFTKRIQPRRIQHGGALHVVLGQDPRPIDGRRYTIIQTQIYDNGMPDFIYYGQAKAIYPVRPQICRESARCEEPAPSYCADGIGNDIKFAPDGSFSVYEGHYENCNKNGRGKMSYFAASSPLLAQIAQLRTMDDIASMTQAEITALKNQLLAYTPYMIYKGNWVNNTWSGIGTATHSNGMSYKGHWENGIMSGKGTLRQPDGSVYIGKFLNNVMSGLGKMRYANGDVYVGFWQNNMKSGRGQMRYRDGRVYHGDWQNDEPVQRMVFGRMINPAEFTPHVFTRANSEPGDGFQSASNIFRRSE